MQIDYHLGARGSAAPRAARVRRRGAPPTWHEQLTHHGAAVQTQRDEKADPAVAGKWPDECGDLPGPRSTSGV
jgi:hypothetical protein